MKYENLYAVRQINNLKEMLDSSVALYGDKAAFLVKRKENSDYSPISYKQFKADVDALGTALLSLGLKNAKIAIIGENRYEWATSYLAVVNGVGVVVPLDKELPAHEIQNLIDRSKADAIIYSSHVKHHIDAITKASVASRYYINMDAEQNDGSFLSYQSLLQKGYDLMKSGNRDFLDAKINEEVMSMLLFTSGTTDKSKAVMLSHRNISENLMNMCSMLYIDEKDVFLSVLPLHHTYECTCGFLCQMYRGCTIAFCEGLRHIVKNLKESKCTMMNGVPLIFESMYKQILNQAAKKKGGTAKLKFAVGLSNTLRKVKLDIRHVLFAQVHEGLGGHLRLFISGAAGIDPQVAKGFRDIGIKLVQGYGLTECSPIVALNRDINYKDEAAGLPLPNLQVEIHNPDADGVGEIKCKGSSVMLGYYENQEATDRVLKDGWFYTGDLGFIDKDNFVHITGRKKNVIVTKNGKNIFPEEIETLLNRSPYVKESLVYGRNESDGDVSVCARIVPNHEKMEEDIRNNAAPGSTAEEIIGKEVKRINKELVSYKHIKDFILQEEEFIKTTTKKIKRHENKV
ncbi:MAG: AMP-binding protein [Clostridia bacterium]|nr:AMP-binding protein [Clostridia bacterium]